VHDLNKLIVEGLGERSLRTTLHSIGVPPNELKEWGTMKLLDCIVRLCQMAHATGLSFDSEGAEIWTRLSKDGTEPDQPIPRLFALYDMRILKAHRSDTVTKLAACLSRFGISISEAGGGYGLVLDRIYDALFAELESINGKIRAAL
jgi:hypothetical protein